MGSDEEIEKYRRVYRDRKYKMGLPRQRFTRHTLENLAVRGSLLDVGTGRGETLDTARDLGFFPAIGTDVVDSLRGEHVLIAPAWELPFSAAAFDVVTCLDVMEHLLPQDEARSLDEIRRVTRRVAFFSIANHSSVWHDEQLHVNRRPFNDWADMLQDRFTRVERLPERFGVRNANWLCWVA